MIGIVNKKDFETLLKDIESSGEDPMVFIREEVRGYHISENHRYWVKQHYCKETMRNFFKSHIGI
jgi:hypothetical protein